MTADNALITDLYKRFRRCPPSLDERGLHLLADYIVDARWMELDDDRIVFSGMDKSSPFREILLRNINGVTDLGQLIAIVMHSSIIFFNKHSGEASVHLRQPSRLELLARRIGLR